jgi:AcrR family transcriptional regulator
MQPLQPGRARVGLDRARILAAALSFVDAHGLDALSMRKLGSELGVEAMALYHYFPSKAAVLDGVVASILEQLEVPPPGSVGAGDWPAVLCQVARSLRRLGCDHPNVVPLLAVVGFDKPATLKPAEAVVDVLVRAGLTPQAAFVSFVTLKSYVVGHLVWAVGKSPGPRFPARLEAAEYPCLAEFVAQAAPVYLTVADDKLEIEFEAGVDLLVDGVRARLDGAS